MNRLFRIEHDPEAADGAVWSVVSPENTSVWRTASSEEAIQERDRRNGAIIKKEEEV